MKFPNPRRDAAAKKRKQKEMEEKTGIVEINQDAETYYDAEGHWTGKRKAFRERKKDKEK